MVSCVTEVGIPGVVIFLAMTLSACAPVQIRNAEGSGKTSATEKTVFGHVVVIHKGKEQEWGSILGPEFAIYIVSERTGEVQVHRIKGDGTFYWTLAPGDYTVAAFGAAGLDTPTRGRIWYKFTVEPSDKAVYIGQLKIALDSSRYAVRVFDDYETALTAYKERFAGAQEEPLKRLMQPEQQLGSYQHVVGICAQEWGIECGRTYQGVEPLQPEGTASAFPRVASLTPTFAWKPSSKTDVSYDFVIYETVSLVESDMIDARIPGKTVFYVGDVKEPKFALQTPLETGKKYNWSVRLRRGDTVSSWSRCGYFAFIIVAFISESGKWFGFSTPSK